MNIDSPGNVTFEDNYVHDLDTTGPSYVCGNDPHTDGIQTGEGTANLVIRHNTIDPIGPQSAVGGTSGIIMWTPTRARRTRTSGSRTTTSTGATPRMRSTRPRQQTHDVYINRNRMQRAAFGYTACVRLGITVTEFNENRDAGTGALISPDNGAGGSCSN